jgi:hypothetical protein
MLGLLCESSAWEYECEEQTDPRVHRKPFRLCASLFRGAQTKIVKAMRRKLMEIKQVGADQTD